MVLFQYYRYNINYIQHLFLILIVLSMVMLHACGFHLRQSINLPFKTIYISFTNNSRLHTELKQHILASGVKIVDSDTLAEVNMKILTETRERRISFLNTDNRVREYSLYLKFCFQLKNNKNQFIIAPTKIFLRRDMTYTEKQELAKQAEESFLYDDMQKELIQLILKQLSTSKTSFSSAL